jgi:hypothetical protein
MVSFLRVAEDGQEHAVSELRHLTSGSLLRLAGRLGDTLQAQMNPAWTFETIGTDWLGGGKLAVGDSGGK